MLPVAKLTFICTLNQFVEMHKVYYLHNKLSTISIFLFSINNETEMEFSFKYN